jgi:large subunit ribosomal protein L18
MAKNDKIAARKRRKRSIRRKLVGTPERPRLTVFRSNTHIYAQVIDDTRGHSVAAASSRDKAVADALKSAESKVDRAAIVGQQIAKTCLDRGIEAVVFDRNGYKYHGRVSALAEAAREAGLSF